MGINNLFWRPYGNGNTFLPRPRKPQYAHPFEDMASVAMPESMQTALEWAQYIVSTNGTYRSALKRVVAYCVTEPEIQENTGENGTVGKEVRENYETLLSDKHMKIMNEAQAVGMDLLTYGNVFISVFSGFTRYMTCNGHNGDKKCRFTVPLKEVLENDRFRFTFRNCEFHATCPYCGYNGAWHVHDIPSKSMDDVFIKRWNPMDIEILDDPFTNKPNIVWNIPSTYTSQVKKGLPHILQTVPIEILGAIKDGMRFRFNQDAILHLSVPSLAGFDMKGWGLPDPIYNFRQAWMSQVCNRHMETTAMEALAPLRVISPPSAINAGDPIYSKMDAAKFIYSMKRAVNLKRVDPSAWVVAPFAIQYQALGGDATQFIPRELQEMTRDNLLDAAGVPVELFKGTLTLQAAPVALRLFMSFWRPLVSNFNIFLQFVVKRASTILGWEPVDAKFAEITQIDDINRQVQTLQLMGSGVVSRTTGLASMGLDQREEVRRMMEEQRDEAEQQDRMQKELETTKQLDDMVGGGTLNILAKQDQMAQQQGGGGGPMGPPGSNMPFPGGTMAGATVPGANGQGMSSLLPGNDPISQMIAQCGIQPTDSLEDAYAKAQTLAQQFMMGNTNSNLRKLRNKDKQLHDMVKAIIDEMRSNAASQGRDMVLQQEFGG